jgi:CubicO group peptidase (beta-lactamase class C family)
MLLSLLLSLTAHPLLQEQPDQAPRPSTPVPIAEASKEGSETALRVARLPERGAPELRAAPVDSMMRSFLREHEVPGASLAICKDGQLVYARGFGWADPENKVPVQPQSQFRIASISKPITAVAVLKLVELGKLKLDAPVFALLGYQDALQAKGCDPRLAQITVLQLLQHRAGWDRQASFDPMFIPQRVQQRLNLDGPPHTKQIIRYMLQQPLDFDPDTRYAYSNFGYCVLGRVIEKVTGQPYGASVRSMLLDPLQLDSIELGGSLPEDRRPLEVWYQDRKQRRGSAIKAPDRELPIGYSHDHEVLDAHGGWIANASDLALFAAAFSDAEHSTLLSPSSVARMWQGPTGTEGPVWYGCGWSVRQVGEAGQNAWHSGLLSGGSSSLLVRRHDGYTWAVLFNTDRSKKTDAVLSGLIDPLIHRAVNQVEAWPQSARD